jgi:hypothetical protein
MKKVFFCLTATVMLASCSNNSRYPVSGKVTYKGAPASGATVFFHRQGGDAAKEPPIIGVVQEDGTFEPMCGSLGKGVPPGHYQVLVEWKRVLGPCACNSGSTPDKEKRRLQYGPDFLNGRYADPKNARFHVTIKQERNQLAPFEVAD